MNVKKVRINSKQEAGPADVLAELERNKGKRRSIATHDLWGNLNHVAVDDAELLLIVLNIPPWEPTEDFADAVFLLPGFAVASHLSKDALHAYLRMLLKALWPDDKEHAASRSDLAGWLLRAYTQRVQVPKCPEPQGWADLC